MIPNVVEFLRELQRRRVYWVATVYAAVAFVLWQVGEIAFPALDLPDGSLTFVIVVTIAGFPLAVVAAWAFDVTPDGIRVTGRRAETSERTNAVDDFARWFAEVRGNPAALMFYALVLAWSGRLQESRELLVDNLTPDPKESFATFGLLLKTALEGGFTNHPWLAEHDPFLVQFRGDPEYEKVLETVKSRWKAAVG